MKLICCLLLLGPIHGLKCLCKRLEIIHCLNLGSLIRSVPAKLIYHSFGMALAGSTEQHRLRLHYVLH